MKALRALVYVALAVSSVRAAAPQVIFSTRTILPGETLRVELDGVTAETKLKIQFRDKTYPLFPVGPASQRALIGIPLSAIPGDHPLTVLAGTSQALIGEGGPWVIHVSTRTFEIENINFKPEKNVLRAFEHKESLRIRKAARHLTPEQSWEGLFAPPVDGATIAPFGLKRMHNGKIPAGFHNGIDLRAPQGTSAKAANAGVVELAANFKAHGKVVMINHGQGVMTIYLHLSAISVHPGQQVARGEPIGKVGSTGMSTAPHVHWQIFVHGVPVDPTAWIEKEM